MPSASLKLPPTIPQHDIPAACRETVTLAAGQGIADPGTVIGRLTASGKAVRWSSAATDGSQVVAGVLLGRVDATDADQIAPAAVRGPARILRNALVFPAGATAAQKDTAVAALAALGFAVHQGA